ncbi:MAG: hypothetical protein NPIRA03_24000 [Nitrospirales bacterium]|nr:MAG: hypothetical protein NPIRA03_24000 [Nitrospirales bacterium]
MDMGEAMEIILAICITGLGIFGGMLVIWNGQYPAPLKEQRTLHAQQTVITGTTQTSTCTTVV